MPRIAVVTTVWQRHNLTDYVLHSYKQRRERLCGKVELILVAAGSEGYLTKEICERNGFAYIEHPNQPLNFKWNAAVLLAKDADPDYVMIVGSDDVVSDDYFTKALERIPVDAAEMFSLNDLYVLGLSGRTLQYWNRQPDWPIGLGRLLNRRVLETVEWQPWSCDVPRNRGLDKSCMRKLEARGIGSRVCSVKDLGSLVVDIKSKDNMNSWQTLGVDELLSPHESKGILERLGIDDIFVKVDVDG